MVEPRKPAPTIKFVDDYCQWYQTLFPEVRSFEAFKYLHVGMISEIKRKTLPAIALFGGIRQRTRIITLSDPFTLDSKIFEIDQIKANSTSASRQRNSLNY